MLLWFLHSQCLYCSCLRSRHPGRPAILPTCHRNLKSCHCNPTDPVVPSQKVIGDTVGSEGPIVSSEWSATTPTGWRSSRRCFCPKPREKDRKNWGGSCFIGPGSGQNLIIVNCDATKSQTVAIYHSKGVSGCVRTSFMTSSVDLFHLVITCDPQISLFASNMITNMTTVVTSVSLLVGRS